MGAEVRGGAGLRAERLHDFRQAHAFARLNGDVDASFEVGAGLRPCQCQQRKRHEAPNQA